MKRASGTVVTIVNVAQALSASAGVQVERVYGYPEERTGEGLAIPLGDLPAGDQRNAVLGLILPHASVGTLPVVEVRLRYRDAQNDGRPVLEALKLQAAITDDPGRVQRGENKLAMEQTETARAAEATRAAMVLYESGQVAQARALARQNADDLSRLNVRLQSKSVQKQSELLMQLDNDISAAPAPSSSAGKGLLKKSKAQAWDQFRSSSK
jgi:DNA-binding XRE family transcriptional regulator